MKYKCLIFDHDDTTVNSTATIHYPCFVEYLKEFRPGMTLTLEDYFLKNFEPGFIEMAKYDFGLSEEDLVTEVEYWNRYVQSHVPVVYEGIKTIMDRQKEEGGLIAVISHSFKQNILRDYARNNLPQPDEIFGWEQPVERRKPNVWPVEQILRKFDLQPSDCLMIDDLKPGYDMAISAGIDFAAAGWANDIAIIEQFMRTNCEHYFKTVEELQRFLEIPLAN